MFIGPRWISAEQRCKLRGTSTGRFEIHIIKCTATHMSRYLVSAVVHKSEYILRLFFNAHVYFVYTAFKRHTCNTRGQKANPHPPWVCKCWFSRLSDIYLQSNFTFSTSCCFFILCRYVLACLGKKKNAPSKLALAVCLTSMYRSQAASETVCSLHLSFAGTQRGGRNSCLRVSTVVCLWIKMRCLFLYLSHPGVNQPRT